MYDSELNFALLIGGLGSASVSIYLAYIFYSRLQARLLEFMFVLILAMLPLGLFLRSVQEQGSAKPYYMEDILRAIALGLLAASLLFAGAIWGLSCVRRLSVNGTWLRLILIILGLGFVSSIPISLYGLISVMTISLDEQQDTSLWIFVYLFGFPVCSILVFFVENCCRNAIFFSGKTT